MNEPAPMRSERSVVGFLAVISILMAFGIDAALPAFDQLRLDFDLDARGLSPAITGTVYFVGAALGQLFYGLLGDRFGRRPILLLGFGIYAIGAFGAAIAPNLEVLLLARLVWGFGASAPLVLRMAIARDLFEGDRMAKVVTTISAVFLLGPIFMPVLGEAILVIGSWRLVFATAILLAALCFLWALRFGETMHPEHRRPLRLGPLSEAFSAVVRTPVTLWAITAQTFFSAAFFIWLGSAQPILDTIYDRDAQFTLFFGASGAGMAVALLLNRRLIDRFGIRVMALRSAVAFVAVTTAGTVAALAAGGVPSVWTWFAWAVAANAMTMVMTPMSTALALEPMADKAGTVSAIIGVAQIGVGSVLAAFVDAQIDVTVTPMLVGSLVFGAVGLATLVVAVRSDSAAGDVVVA